MTIGEEEQDRKHLAVTEGDGVERALRSPKLVAEEENISTPLDDYQFDDPWPTAKSFYGALGDLLDHVSRTLAVDVMTPSTTTGGRDPGEMVEAAKSQAERRENPSKRARQDSNTRWYS